MKRIIVFALAALTFTACDNEKNTDTTVDTTTADSAIMGTSDTDTNQSMQTTTTTTTTTGAYTPTEGDVTYRNGKVMVWRNGDYVESDKDVTLDNGITVRRNGEVRRDDKVVVLEEGETVSRTGNFFNKAGEAVEDGWDATKKGAKKAAGAVKEAGKNVGEAVKDVVD